MRYPLTCDSVSSQVSNYYRYYYYYYSCYHCYSGCYSFLQASLPSRAGRSASTLRWAQRWTRFGESKEVIGRSRKGVWRDKTSAASHMYDLFWKCVSPHDVCLLYCPVTVEVMLWLCTVNLQHDFVICQRDYLICLSERQINSISDNRNQDRSTFLPHDACA